MSKIYKQLQTLSSLSIELQLPAVELFFSIMFAYTAYATTHSSDKEKQPKKYREANTHFSQ